MQNFNFSSAASILLLLFFKTDDSGARRCCTFVLEIQKKLNIFLTMSILYDLCPGWT